MFSRWLGIPILLGAAVGGPYLASNAPSFEQLWPPQAQPAEMGGTEAPETFVPVADTRDRWWGSPTFSPRTDFREKELVPSDPPLEGLPRMSIYEIFRFDISKEWVYQRWARKSTALSELGLFGIRVPVVTGTELHDIAGALTYFFDQQGVVQRISFRGNTGDTSQLVVLATQGYGLQPQSTPVVGEQLFQIRRKNDVFSELRTRPSAVLWSNSPHNSFSVEVDLQRPDSKTPLPTRMPELPEIPEHVVKEQEVLEQAEKEMRSKERLETFFPRSRTPPKQVENLDRRNRSW